MQEEIRSRNNPKILRLLDYKDAKGELFLVEGFHLVEMALASGAVEELYSEERFYSQYPSIPQYKVSRSVLEKLASSKTPEGIVALCHKNKGQAGEPSPLAVYLDDVQDPGNVGTLLRSALAFGAKEILLSKGSANPYGSKALMASQGAIFALDVRKSEADPFEDLKDLRKRGYYLLSTDLRNSIPLRDFRKPEKPLCLILGNEGRGVERRLTDFADESVYLPIEGIESLNVGVAGSILLYELSKGATHE